MDSIEKVNRKNIIIYVPGLGSKISYFNKHMQKLKNKNEEKIEIYNKELDIDFETDLEKYKEESLDVKIENDLYKFSKIVSDLVDFINKNQEKTILIKTLLSYSYDEDNKRYNYDSVNKQTKKLVNLIKAIKNIDKDINIKLVGHSLGGIINLKAAVEVPELIDEIISISTPYSKVFLANILYLFSLGFNAYNILKNFILNTNEDLNDNNLMLKELGIEDEKEKKKYLGIISTLKNDFFFNQLKKKWENLKNKVKLTVIAGVSGQFKTSVDLKIFKVDFKYFKYPYDGLVFEDEQTNINTPYKYILKDTYINCSDNDEENKNSSLYDLIIKRDCKEELPVINLGLIISDIKNWKKQLVDYTNGFFDKPLKYEENKFIYKITNSKYSHSYLQDAEETIDIIYSKIV